MFNTEFEASVGANEVPMTVTLKGNVIAEGVGIIMPNRTVMYRLDRYSKSFERGLTQHYNNIGIDVCLINPF